MILSFAQGVLVLVLYAILRNPCLARCIPRQKSYYTASNTDVGTLPPPSLTYSNHLAVSNNTINMMKGSRTSLINDVSHFFCATICAVIFVSFYVLCVLYKSKNLTYVLLPRDSL